MSIFLHFWTILSIFSSKRIIFDRKSIFAKFKPVYYAGYTATHLNYAIGQLVEVRE